MNKSRYTESNRQDFERSRTGKLIKEVYREMASQMPRIITGKSKYGGDMDYKHQASERA